MSGVNSYLLQLIRMKILARKPDKASLGTDSMIVGMVVEMVVHSRLHEYTFFLCLLCFDSLPLFVLCSTFHNSLHNFSGVDMLKLMLLDFLVNSTFFGCKIGVVGERNE